ncbi:helix-turn-helix domain-containing protein [Cohnella yongneupensis]|uniref:Helix-turn-helix domain-containing protein n=1 Tax=Cohnella yongneupensis TaxID=425006 RepID=A0ABW0R4Y2_9BACL
MEPLEFGQFLRSLREGKKLTMRKLDNLSGVSHSYISQIERGERGIPSPDILNKLAGPLGVSPAVFMVKAGHVSYGDWFTNKVNSDEYDEMFMHEMFGFSTNQEYEDFKNDIKNGELKSYLSRKIVLYNGFLLTDQDRQRVLDMLKALFPDYATKE